MTPQPQQKLQCPYARTLEEVGDFCLIKDNWVGTQDCGKCPARSRPALSPSEQRNAVSFRAIIEQNRAEAASQARKDFAEIALERLDYMPHAKNDGELETAVYVHDVRQMLESLRQQGGEQR